MNVIATEWRMEMIKKAEEITIINDAYNANPASMQAALEAMYGIARESRAIAVLGDMAELGSVSDQAHLEVGRLAVDYGTDVLITVGRKARTIARSAHEKGRRRHPAGHTGAGRRGAHQGLALPGHGAAGGPGGLIRFPVRVG